MTPVGVTEEAERGPGVGHGTGEGALISSLNLDSGVNNRMETMAETKLLDFNLEKSSYMIIGKKKAKE